MSLIKEPFLIPQLNDIMAGFSRSVFTLPDGSESIVASTQIEATDCSRFYNNEFAAYIWSNQVKCSTQAANTRAKNEHCRGCILRVCVGEGTSHYKKDIRVDSMLVPVLSEIGH